MSFPVGFSTKLMKEGVVNVPRQIASVARVLSTSIFDHDEAIKPLWPRWIRNQIHGRNWCENKCVVTNTACLAGCAGATGPAAGACAVACQINGAVCLDHCSRL